jgi:hypothetical protein
MEHSTGTDGNLDEKHFATTLSQNARPRKEDSAVHDIMAEILTRVLQQLIDNCTLLNESLLPLWEKPDSHS